MNVLKLSLLTIFVAFLGIPLNAQSIKYSSKLIAGGSPAGAGENGPALRIPLEDPTGLTFGPDGALYLSEFQGGRVRRVDSAGNMTTIAGGGNVTTGEKGPALQAALMGPATIAFDREGNLYIAEQLGNRVRKVNRKGIITTIAGDGTGKWVRDGVPATQSSLVAPNGLAFDKQGNLYVSEFMGQRVRKISPNGTITTVAGNGKTASTGDGGPAINASLNAPTGLAIDSDGNLFVAEIIGYKVRKIDTAGIISTVADNMNGPSGLAIDPQGNLWIAEHFAMNLRKLDTRGTLTTLPQKIDAYNLAFDSAANLHASQEQVGVISRVNTGTEISGQSVSGLVVVAGTPQSPATTGVADQTALKMPAGIARDSQGNVYIAEIMGNRIRKVDAQGLMTTFAGTGNRGFSGDGGPATSADLEGPGSVGFDDKGNMYIVEIVGNRVRRVDSSGVIQTIAGTGETGFGGDGGPAINAKFNHLHWGGYDKRTGSIYVVDTLNYRIRQIDSQGIVTTIAGNGQPVSAGDGGLLKNASFARPEQIGFDSAGNWYITDSVANVIRKVDAQTGIISRFAGNGKKGYSGEGKSALKARLWGPTGIAVASEGTIYFTDIMNDAVRRIDPNGKIWYVAGNPPRKSFDLSLQKTKLVAPWGIVVNETISASDELTLPPGVDVASACAAAAAQVSPSTPTSPASTGAGKR